MEPPEKDNVIDMMEKLKEKLKKEHPDIKKLMEADYDQFKEMVAHNIVNIYNSMGDIMALYNKTINSFKESMIKILTLNNKMQIKQAGMHEAFFIHMHKGDELTFPEGRTLKEILDENALLFDALKPKKEDE